MPTRRSVLGSICATAAVATAGCSGGDGDDQGNGDGTDDDQESDDGNAQNGNGQSDDGQSADGDEWEFDGDPGDVPGEEQAKGIVDAYLLAVSQGDPSAFNTVVHPESPFAGAFTDEDIEQAGQYLNYYYRNMSVTELDRETGRAVVEYDLAIETSDGQERTEASKELRVHDGSWRIWLTAPLEGSPNENS